MQLLHKNYKNIMGFQKINIIVYRTRVLDQYEPIKLYIDSHWTDLLVQNEPVTLPA